jgi:hypothetical protein
MNKKLRLFVATVLTILVGAGVPLLERVIKCQQPTSEACVWAKAYLPLSFGLWSIAGVVAGVVAWFVLRAFRRD